MARKITHLNSRHGRGPGRPRKEHKDPKGPAPEPLFEDVRYRDPEARVLGKTVRARVGGQYVYGLVTGYMDCHPAIERAEKPRLPGHPPYKLPEWLEEKACGPGYPKMRILILDPRDAEKAGLKDEDWYPMSSGWEIKYKEEDWG